MTRLLTILARSIAGLIAGLLCGWGGWTYTATSAPLLIGLVERTVGPSSYRALDAVIPLLADGLPLFWMIGVPLFFVLVILVDAVNDRFRRPSPRPRDPAVR